MQNNQNDNITSMKTELSLVALLCLAPLVQRHLRTRDEELSADDLVFIKGYITLGNINLILLILICDLVLQVCWELVLYLALLILVSAYFSRFYLLLGRFVSLLIFP